MNDTRNCSFCGRNESETIDLLPGVSKGFVCFECVEQNSFGNINANSAAICDFCGRRQREAPKMFSGNGAEICSICVELISAPPVLLMRSGFIADPKTRFGNWLLTSDNRFIKKYIRGE